MHGFVLEHADHFETGAVADVRQAAVGVAAERPLVDTSVRRAVEQCAPRFQLSNPIGRFLGVDLRHAPVVVHLAAAHRVAEMHAPVVFAHHVPERRCGAAFGHNGVGLAEQRFADERDFGFLGARFDGGTQAGAAGTDDHNVVGVTLEVGGSHQNSRTSRMTPIAQRRM